MTKQEALKEINETQSFYVSKLVDMIRSIEDVSSLNYGLKEVSFTSPTGTGKTKMMADVIRSMPDRFFVVTTLSRGQLKYQIEDSLANYLVGYSNYLVFGLNDLTTATKLKKKDVLAMLPNDKRIIWFRDEGHIATNRWMDAFKDVLSLIVNFSATNKISNGIQCNFTHTMMLRTPTQRSGTPEEALEKLMEVKKAHQTVREYNPCALFRVMDNRISRDVVKLCDKFGLKCINITDENFEMSDLCRDDNEYDVIINKFKITEGIDLRRCHVIYIDNKPKNEATVIQIIGRARRNALLWRDDVDILSDENAVLLRETRKCYVFYNAPEAKVEQTSGGELLTSLCDKISVESLKCDIDIEVDGGRLKNGLSVLELEGKTGKYHISKDEKTGFNVVDNPNFYARKTIQSCDCVLNLESKNLNIKKIYFDPVKVNTNEFVELFKEDRRDDGRVRILAYEAACEERGIKYDFEGLKQRIGFYDTSKEIDKNIIYSVRHEPLFSRDIHYDVDFYYSTVGKEPEVRAKYGNICVHRVFRKNKDTAIIVPYYSKEESVESHCKESSSPMIRRLKRSFINDSEMWRISEQFIPFITKIEYVDYEFQNNIRKKIIGALDKKYQNYHIIGKDRYVYSRHPSCRQLEYDGISTLKKLAREVKHVSYSFMGYSKRNWETLLANITDFKQIDNYDIQTVSLSSLNSILNIGISEKEIHDYVSEEMPIIETTDKELFRQQVVKLNENVISPKCGFVKVYLDDFTNHYYGYSLTRNDKEIAMIGMDTMRYIHGNYVEDTPVTSKIVKYSKLNRFISQRYKKQLDDAKDFLFSTRFTTPFDAKCNSCIGYCVEYFAKLKLYGDDFFSRQIEKAKAECHAGKVTDAVSVRACMIAYKERMALTFGDSVQKVIPTISADKLLEENYSEFVKTVVELGTRAVEFIDNAMHIKESAKNEEKMVNPDLSVNHISALCDFINKDTILDVKVTGAITLTHVQQVLAYHYLSTKRSDLAIKRLIIYEAVTGRSLEIDI